MHALSHVAALADDLGVDVEDVRVVAAWLAGPAGVDDAELDLAVRDVLDPGGERTARERAGCPACGRLPGPSLVLVGWQPCRCGGHGTTRCRADNGGCGFERFEPDLRAGCIDPAFGFAPPAT